MKIVAAAFLICLATAVILGQISLSDVRAQRPVDPRTSLESALQVPADVQHAMNKACNNCHSYATKWPWYSRIAPLNWLIESDVRNARAAVNYSDWTSTAGSRRGTALGILAAACEDARTRRMPPAPYRMMHAEANLSEREVDSLCTWSRAAMQQIKRQPNSSSGHVATASR